MLSVAVVTHDHPHHPHATPTTALKHVTNAEAARVRVWMNGSLRIIAAVVMALVAVGATTAVAIAIAIVLAAAIVIAAGIGAVVRGDLAGNEVGVVLAVLVDDEVDEVPHGRVEEDGAHHQVE